MSFCSDSSDRSEMGEVDHGVLFFKSFEILFDHHELSDVTFIVEGASFPAHKLILAAQSEYFRDMLFGGLKESSQKEIVLKDAKKKSFEILLEYFYTARMILTGVEMDLLLDVLELSQKWNIRDLPNEICRFLERNLDVSYLWKVYNIAQTYGYEDLSEECIDFADYNAVQVVQHKSFLNLSSAVMKELISHDIFFAPEEMIFERLCIWISKLEAPLDSEVLQVLEKIRWRYIELPDYARISRDLEVKWDRAAKGMILKEPLQSVRKRSYGLRGVNVADAKCGAKVVKPNGAEQYAVDGESDADQDKYTSHKISPNGNEAIVIELDREYLLSFIKMQLWGFEDEEYSYYIEVSDDQMTWVKIVDYREFRCSDWQHIHFDPRIIRYIKIVGTGAYPSRKVEFRIYALQAYYFRTSPTYFDKKTGFFVSTNSVLKPRRRNCDYRTRDCKHDGYRHDHWKLKYNFMWLFPQPIKTSVMEILLFDPARKGGNYKVEVSKDKEEWKEIGTLTPSASWQVLKFELTPLTYVRVIRPKDVETVPLCIELEYLPEESNTTTNQ